MKKILATTLLVLATNVSAAPSELSQINSLSSAVIELQMINYAGPKADLSPSNFSNASQNINSLGKAALAKHAADVQFLSNDAKLVKQKPTQSEEYFTSLFPAVLAKHYKTAPSKD